MSTAHAVVPQRRPEPGRDAATLSIELPASADPALAGTLQSSLQNAAELFVANEAAFLGRVDELAQLVVGIARPSSELLEDRIRRLQTVREVFEQGDWLTAEQINALQANPPANKAHPASDWKRRGRIFSVGHAGKEYFARYQFDAMYQPLPVIKRILEAFGEVADPWVLAAWFHHPNGWLAEPRAAARKAAARAVAPMRALDHSDAVVQAAARRRGSYVA